MKRLLDIENKGPLLEKTWLHTGSDGRDKLTIETFQDVEPVFKKARELAQRPKEKEFQYLGSIPVNLINEICKELSATWGIQVREAYGELMSSKSERSKRVWKMLLQSRDYRKLQAKNYAP